MPNPTEYYRPNSLDEAAGYAGLPGSIALAGGALTLRGVDPPYRVVVDLQDLHDLKAIEYTSRGLLLGGAASLQKVVESDYVSTGLKEALTRTLPVNIRNGASVGESLIAPNPPREWLAGLAALGATVEHVTGGAQQDTPLEVFIGLAHSEKAYRGLVTGILLPVGYERAAFGSAFVARTPADFPIVNAAVYVELNLNERIHRLVVALGGVSALPVMTVDMTSFYDLSLDNGMAREAGEMVKRQAQPVPDYKGSAEYRREMAGVCVRRALAACKEQLKTP